MKIKKLYNVSELWHWLQDNLPNSFEAQVRSEGYGGVNSHIYRKGEVPSLWKRIFNDNPIALIIGNKVVLYDSSYLSDFEDLLEKFEKETRSETELTYWES